MKRFVFFKPSLQGEVWRGLISKTMNEIVILSGKGGTGKTELKRCIATLNNNTIVAGSCDVDAANLHLVESRKLF